ncbi:MAG: hypothetical protein L6R42_007639 [Xanthoria sp. 1 TBL-2021]|nr:MAG: hypothetical protein L6R42_007639 [Xanthoria sp. 1 TBL-2021]
MPRGQPLVESSGKKPKHRNSKRTASVDDFPSTRHPAINSEDSPTKRIKLTHPPAQGSSSSVNNMYNFSRPNHVDLTNGNGPATMTKVQKPLFSMAKPVGTATEAGPRKLVVKNFRKTPRSDPEKYINEVSSQLDAALSAILADEKLPHSNEELYRGAENLCRQGRAPQLYKSLREKCQQGIEMYFAKPLLTRASTLDDIGMLSAVMEAWATWNIGLKTIRSIYFFLDRSYLLNSPSLPSIEAMGTNEFRDLVFLPQTLKPRILGGACELLAADRQMKRNPERGDLLRKAIKMFHALSVYTSSFEPEFLARSSSYISAWSDQKAEALDLAPYIEESVVLIGTELARCSLLGLDSTTQKTIETYLLDLLVDQDDRQKKLLDTRGVSQLLEEGKEDTMYKLYTLLDWRDSTSLSEQLRVPFEAYISEQGSKIVFDEARENEMVPRLLAFKGKLDSVWKKCFREHEGLGHTLREAFEAFINKSKRSTMTWGTDNPKPGEMIAKYVNLILEGRMKASSGHATAGKANNNEDVDMASEDEDVEITKQLDQVLELFRFLHGKAVFEAFYKKALAKRLLLNRSASADAEKSMLTRLASECGAGFTHNLEQMFKDMELAREEVKSYNLMLDQEENRPNRPNIDLTVSVLSSSAWPSYPDISLNIPRDVQQAATLFEQHYKNKHRGRRLEWKHSQAHCQLKAVLPKGTKEFVVSSLQAVVLLLFSNPSNNNELSYVQIQAETGLDDIQLKRTLQSLACGQYRVLKKNPKGKEVNTDDSFSVNPNFSHPKYRIKINNIQAQETKEENKETHERVAADRHFETQAAIVRIMKGRKTITHANLVVEVINATKSRGVLDQADIKSNIERLIDKEYMEREERDDGLNVYCYVA